MTTALSFTRPPLVAIAIATAIIITVGAVAPTIAASEASEPNPLRRGDKLRVQDIAATDSIVAIGWRQGRKPTKLMVTLSKDAGRSFLRNNGELRKFNNLGLGRVGLSLDICGKKGDRDVWIISASRSRGDEAGDSDVLLTRRSVTAPISDAYQTFLTPPSKVRSVSDVDIACVGNKYLAIAWLERNAVKSRARVMIRDQDASGRAEWRKVYNLGSARLKGGVSVSATGPHIHVTWTTGARKNLRYRRFTVNAETGPPITPERPMTLAWRDIKHPEVATRGKKVIVAYSDAGKVKAKISRDVGQTFAVAERLIDVGTIRKPSRVHSVAMSGDRIVVEAIARHGTRKTPQRVQSFDLGASWESRSFGHDGKRLGALQKIDFPTALLKETWHHDGPRRDTLRALVEAP